MTTADRLQEIYQTLHESLGPQHWWPGESATEIAVGAILTQNTQWRNVEMALANLRQANVLSISALAALPQEQLAVYIKPAGYFRRKAGRLKNFVTYIMEHFDGDLESFLQQGTQTVRESLLAISGIGPETADSIALYAGNHPVFVIDTYTHRVLTRHGLIDETADYYTMQQLFQDHLPEDVALFNDYHAQIVAVGKQWCHKSKPVCDQCPLKADLSDHGLAMTVTE